MRLTARRALAPLALSLSLAIPTRAAGAQSLPGSLVYSIPGGTVADNRLTTFSFVVQAPDVLPATGSITVRFRDFVAAAAGDVFALLTYTPLDGMAPTRALRIFDPAPGGYADRAFDGSYSFGLSFALGLPSGLVASGDFTASPLLSSTFTGKSIAGRYELQLYDGYSNGGGTVGGLDLAFDLGTTSVVPEPSTIALVAAGLCGVFGVARRRRATDARPNQS